MFSALCVNVGNLWHARTHTDHINATTDDFLWIVMVYFSFESISFLTDKIYKGNTV